MPGKQIGRTPARHARVRCCGEQEWDWGWAERESLFYFTYLLFILWPCYMACRILAPQPGIKRVPSALGAESEPLDQQESP